MKSSLSKRDLVETEDLFEYCNLQWSSRDGMFHFADQYDRANDQNGWRTVAREIPMHFAWRFTAYFWRRCRRRKNHCTIAEAKALFYEWLESD